ncbi:MAG: F0F1 ATP synthase subunit A [Candidatus Lambdaproteobacteria bacterium]|nr:F0F1 ATP synthase subunit A [Candidatus Lambdaproteobacteria bacterium]
MEHGVIWGELLFPGLAHLLATYGIDPVPAIDALLVSLGLLALAWFGGRKFRGVELREPEGRLSLPFFMELLLGGMLRFFGTIIHHGAEKLFFVLGTLALFILANNLIGLVPGFNPPTDQYNVTVALALITFVTAHTIGIRTHGLSYIKKFLGPIWWMSPLIFPIELISHLVRPLSLSVRLFGNMTGDHKVVAVFTTLLALGLPVPFMGLGIFVSFLQAFVFVLLSSVYFQDALEHAH